MMKELFDLSESQEKARWNLLIVFRLQSSTFIFAPADVIREDGKAFLLGIIG